MKRIPFSVLKLINVFLVTIPFVVVWFAYYEQYSLTTRSMQVSTMLLLLYLGCFYYFGNKLDSFRASINRVGDLIFGQIIAACVTNSFGFVMIWMLSINFPNLWPMLGSFAAQCVIITCCCWASQFLFFASFPPRRVVILYHQRRGMENLISAYGLAKRYDVLGVYSVEDMKLGDTLAEQDQVLEAMLGSAGEVFMSGIPTRERNILLNWCFNHNKRVLMIPMISDMLMSASERIHMFHLPFLRVGRYYPSLEFRMVKRGFDILISGLALVLLSPLFLVIALMVRSDGGPALFRQVRLTQNGKEFKILKFRSMCMDAEKYTGAVLSAGEDDPRITRIGHIIRAFRLDELPQLWNIFVGDMSIVGPRPERPEIAAKIQETLPEFSLRLQCKAGLTGYAQVYGKYNTEPYDKLLMDLMYIAQPSLLEDLTIMLATVKILFSKESTEGVTDQHMLDMLRDEDRSA